MLDNHSINCGSGAAREKRKCNLARISGGRRGKRIGCILHVCMQLVNHEGGYGDDTAGRSVCIFHFATAAAHTHKLAPALIVVCACAQKSAQPAITLYRRYITLNDHDGP